VVGTSNAFPGISASNNDGMRIVDDPQRSFLFAQGGKSVDEVGEVLRWVFLPKHETSVNIRHNTIKEIIINRSAKESS
jgi:hypothetical protein